MTAGIRRASYPDYASYMDAIWELIGGATNPPVWDEDEGVWVLNPDVDLDRVLHDGPGARPTKSRGDDVRRDGH